MKRPSPPAAREGDERGGCGGPAWRQHGQGGRRGEDLAPAGVSSASPPRASGPGQGTKGRLRAYNPQGLQRLFMRFRIFLFCVVLAAAGAAASWYAGLWQLPAVAATPPQPQGRRGAFEGGKVPVVAGTVEKKDVPIWLDGLGTVQAFNMVVV